MQRAVVVGLTLICVCLVFSLSGPSAQRIAPEPSAPTTRPAQVEVTNFPAVQQVAGTVSVGNLPVDVSGRLLVAIQPSGPGALVLHSTTSTYQGNLGGRTGATQKCRAEFPVSHFATEQEVLTALNTRGVVWLTSDTDWSWLDGIGRPTCGSPNDWQATTNSDGSRIDGDLIRAKGTDVGNPGPCSDFHPILCAE